MRFLVFPVLLNAVTMNANINSDVGAQILGYVTYLKKERTQNILSTCFKGLGFDSSSCEVCGWGSGTPDMSGVQPLKMLEASTEMNRETPPTDANFLALGPDMDDCVKPCTGSTENEKGYEVCDTFDTDSGVRPQESKMNCASSCAKLCKATAGCDATSFSPRRTYTLYDGSDAFYDAYCALYDLDDYLGPALSDTTDSQLNCDKYDDYGGAFPYINDVWWKETDLSGTFAGGWCIECCDNRRLDFNFDYTIAMHCDYSNQDADGNPWTHGGLGGLMDTEETDFDKLKDTISDLEFRFAKRDNEDSKEETVCYLNRFNQYMIGYNLTIGVKEYSSGTSYWKGVEWCTVEPIEATQEFWNLLKQQPSFKFIELITVTNVRTPFFSSSPQGLGISFTVLIAAAVVWGSLPF